MKLKPLTLTEICPEDASFTLSDGSETYTIRKFTLADQAWIQKTFGGGQNAIQEAFTNAESMIRIVFHQLPVEQQKAFTPVTIERVDDESGEVITEKVGGWRLLAGKLTNTAKDIEAMAEALTKAIVGSNAILEDEPEKKTKAAEELRTGGQSLTSSRASTATASI